MDTTASIVSLLITMATNSIAQNSSFGSLPQGNYIADTIAVANSGSLNTLFSMAQGFVNVVFKPFSDLEEYIRSVLESDSKSLGNSWQEVVSLEVGFIVCVVFGLLFILLVPLAGSIMCCCRCCCGKCGGRLEQSEKRSRSCYRQCLCATMLILTTLMAVPTVFVFLTNERVKDLVNSGPAKTIAVLNDMTTYVDLLPEQVDYMTAQYSTVDENIRPLVLNFNESVGVPLQSYVSDLSQPAMEDLDATIEVTDDSKFAINEVDASLTNLEEGMATLDRNLTDLKNRMDAALGGADCNADSVCLGVQGSTDGLVVGLNISHLNQLRADLDPVNETLYSFNVKEMKSDIENQIARIPSEVGTQTQSASDDAVQSLNEAQSTVDDVSNNLPDFEDIKNVLSNVNNSINDAFTFYDDYIDQYTYIAGIVLGCMLAVIVVSYVVGVVLGVCGSRGDIAPDERGCGSNCGGIMLMVGVGLSFIFSFLLMILVIFMFTIGGHGERYGCQSLEGPEYQALAIAEDFAAFNLSDALGLPQGVDVTLTEVLRSCKYDVSAYEAFKLENVFNVTEKSEVVASSLGDLKTNADTAVDEVDLSAISVYSEENQADLLELKGSGVDSVNYTEYLVELENGITEVDLAEYATFLRESAANFSSASVLQEEVEGFAVEVEAIQRELVEPLQDDYVTLEKSINILVNVSQDLNSTVDELDQSLMTFNNSIQSGAPAEIQKLVDDIYEQINGNVTAYTDWITIQVEDELGACKPFYNSYTELIGVFCDYFIDTVNGLWFSLGWAVFLLIPSAIIAMKLMKFYRTMNFGGGYEDSWDDEDASGNK